MTLHRLRCFLWVLLFASTSSLATSERIVSFNSDIFVSKSSSVRVVETIKVIANRQQIKRGIYRDFPTHYRDHLNNRYVVGFDVIEVTRDGLPEPYFVQRVGRYKRVYIGQRDQFIEPGEHRYQITYTTTRQLGYFDEHDELYWNVTGNEWAFPIDQATATIQLPDGIAADDMRVLGFTGPYGSNESALTASIWDDGLANFEATRALKPYEGLTVVVMWPKGVVVEPTISERLGYTLRDNRHIVAGILGLCGLLAYYVLVWFRVGKDPEPGVIYARYKPPANFSPAAVRFIRKMGYDHKTFAAALVNLAVKGWITIEEEGSTYVLTKRDSAESLSKGERRLQDRLFATSERVELKNSNHHRIASAISAHKAALSSEYATKFFIKNVIYFIGGLLLSCALVGATILLSMRNGVTSEEAGQMVMLLVMSLMILPFAMHALHEWRGATTAITRLRALITSGTTIFVFGIAVVVMFGGVLTAPFVLRALTISVVLINLLFYYWLKSPTRLGRELLDEVDGFREYVDIAERLELDYRYPGGRCPELFEKYLPYAIALDIEQAWGRQFAATLRDASSSSGAGYAPSWYVGSDWNVNRVDSFTTAMGSSVSSAVRASSVAPGSSSGGGGGGFSGGGGGGGGGGGW